jgi:hypothetical protein
VEYILATICSDSWTEVNSGLATLNIASLGVCDNNIFDATSGKGVWRRPLSEMTGIISSKPRRGIMQPVHFRLISSERANHSIPVEFFLPHPDRVAIKIYNHSGREITTFVNNYFESGAHTLSWNTWNVATGCYTVRMQTGTNSFVKSVTVIK